MQWQKWIPNTKVTSGAFAAAAAFIVVSLWDDLFSLTNAEAFAAGSAVAVIIAYLVPERRNGGDGG